MRNNIVLSGKRDADLVAIYKKLGRAEFMNLTKEALRALVRGKGPKVFDFSSDLPPDTEQETIPLSLVITSEKDEDVRELLSHVRAGNLGYFVKQAIRFYIGPVHVLSQFMNTDFSHMLLSSSVPIQVFAIGNIQDAVSVRKKPAKRKRTQRPKTTTTKREPSNLQPTYQTPVVQPSTFENVVVNNTPQVVEDATVGNENVSEDEMLAMLENLLG